MQITILSSIEKDEIMYSIKFREYPKTERLFEAFKLFIKNHYDKNIETRYRFSREDFTSDCHLLILECVNKFRGNSFGELCKYITKTIEERSKTMAQEHDKHCKYNVLGSSEDNSSLIIESHLNHFEEKILSVLTLNSHQGKYRQDKLTEYDVELVKTHIYNGDFKEVAARRGVKYSSVMQALARALEKIRKIALSLGITSNNADYIIA